MTAVKLTADLDPSYQRLHEAVGENALTETFMAPRPSVEERAAAGKTLRQKVPRSGHAEYAPRANRPFAARSAADRRRHALRRGCPKR